MPPRSSARDRDAGPRATAHPAASPPPVPVALTLAAIAWGALAALLLLAPPESARWWAVNGFRSTSLGVRLALLAGAGCAWWLARSATNGRVTWTVASLGVAALVAFPLHERLHLLGDTQIRIQAIASFDAGRFALTWVEWSHLMHAQPLDVLVDFLTPIGLTRLGLAPAEGVRIVSFGLALLFLAGIWRVGGRISSARLRLPVCCALAFSGALEAFAGYAESAGLLLAAGAWWWGELLAPLAKPRAAWRLLAAWALLVLAHRQALGLAPAMLFRALVPVRDGDREEPRRSLLWGTLTVAALGAIQLLIGNTAAELRGDSADFAAALGQWRRTPLADLANLAVLVAPMLVMAPALAMAPRVAPKDRVAWLFAIAIAPLLPLVLTVLVGPHELGAHRDWDAVAFLGWSVTLAVAVAVASRGEAFARRALVPGVSVLALLAGSWLAVNADPVVAERRAERLAADPALPENQRGMVEMFLGQLAMNHRDAPRAARHLDAAYALAPNPRFLLLAAEAWARAGDFAAARKDLRKAWESRGLSDKSQQAARSVEQLIDALERGAAAPRPAATADSTR